MSAAAFRSDPLASVRARGSIDIAFARGPRGTYAADIREVEGARVRLPRHGPSAGGRCEAILINTGGGIAGGDRLTVRAVARSRAEALVTTQAAERIYRSLGLDSEIDVTLAVESGAALVWMPQETILYSGARLSRRITADVAPDARLLIAEIAVFGRTAMGERLADGALTDRWEIRRDGRLAYVEAIRLDGDLATVLARAAVCGPATTVATLVSVAPDAEEMRDRLRAALGKPRAHTFVSAWNGLLCLRSLGQNCSDVRADIATAVAALTGGERMRVWAT